MTVAGNRITLLGTKDKMTSFNIDPPKALITITTGDEVTVKFNSNIHKIINNLK